MASADQQAGLGTWYLSTMSRPSPSNTRGSPYPTTIASRSIMRKPTSCDKHNLQLSAHAPTPALAGAGDAEERLRYLGSALHGTEDSGEES